MGSDGTRGAAGPTQPKEFARRANRITRSNRNRAPARRLDGRALSACPPV